MSAFVHGAEYAVLQHLVDAGPGDDDQHRVVEPVLSEQHLSWVVAVAVDAHAAAYDRYVTLHGWSRADWDAWWATARAAVLRPDLLP
jgi:hypothetical protein